MNMSFNNNVSKNFTALNTYKNDMSKPGANVIGNLQRKPQILQFVYTPTQTKHTHTKRERACSTSLEMCLTLAEDLK